MLIRTIYVGVLDTSEGTGRDILRAKTEKELAETVCYYNTIYMMVTCGLYSHWLRAGGCSHE